MNAERVGLGSEVASKIPLGVHSITTRRCGTCIPRRPAANLHFDYYRDTYKLIAGFLSLLDSMQAQAIGKPAR
jgi:hypothetical protein